jgi:spore maturation protein CgeB
MKLIFFGLSLSSSWGNGHATTYRSLLRGLANRGHDVTFYERDVQWYAQNRDLPEPDFCTLRLYDDLSSIDVGECRRADAVIIGSYVPDSRRLVHMLSGRTMPLLAFYDIDTPITVSKLEAGDTEYLSPEIIPDFDVYLSFSGGPIMQRLQTEFGARSVRLLSCSADADKYFPQNMRRRYALGYLGTYDPSRQPMLDALLVEPARLLPEKKFIVAGPNYPDDIAWPGNVDRVDHLAPSQHADFYASLEFALNVTRADMVRAGFSPSVRIFEAVACARPVITDAWPGLDTVFDPGSEILVANTSRDIADHLAMSADARELLARNGHARFLRDHSASARARQLEDIIIDAAADRFDSEKSGTRPREAYV